MVATALVPRVSRLRASFVPLAVVEVPGAILAGGTLSNETIRDARAMGVAGETVDTTRRGGARLNSLAS